jgi:hypothetical protein
LNYSSNILYVSLFGHIRPLQKYLFIGNGLSQGFQPFNLFVPPNIN